MIELSTIFKCSKLLKEHGKLSMKDLREEILRRRQERRNKRSNTWTSLIVKILLLIFVVLMIRFFAYPDPDKFRKLNSISKPASNEIQDVEE